MKKQIYSSILLFYFFFSLLISCFNVEGQRCKPSGKIRGKVPPSGMCNSECCKKGKYYTTYSCSPPVTNHTNATLKLNIFDNNGDGDGPSECDNLFHTDQEHIVTLSTGWFANKKRCLKNITIYGNGKSVKAKVVDECDSTIGCDGEHDYQPPCHNNIVAASKAVWKALGVSKHNWDELDIYWSD